MLAAVSMAVGLPTLGIGVEAAGADPVTPKAVLVTEGATASSLETPLFNRLKGLGFPEVETVADEAMTAAKTRGANLVVVSPTVASADLPGDELVKVSVPVISMKAYEQDGLQMAGPTATVDHGTFTTDRIQITDPAHPLAAALSGTPIITESPLAIGWVKLPALDVDAHIVAQNAEGNAVLFAWKPGDRMFPERPPNRPEELLNAHGCRVGFPGQRDSATEFTPAGWKLFDAAVSWSRSSACGPTRPYPVNPPVKTCMPNEAPADILDTPEISGDESYAWPQWVDEVLYDNGIYYLGGRFTHVSNWDGSGTVARPGLAACNASTGMVVTDWAPDLHIDGVPEDPEVEPELVRTLTANGGWLYVGGKFDVDNNATPLIEKKNLLRVRLAAPQTNWEAEVDWNWGPALKGGIQAILIDGDALYLGGGVREVNGDDEDDGVSRLVKLSLTTSLRDANFAPAFLMEPPLKPNCTPDLEAEPPVTCIETDPNGKEYSDFASVHSLALDGNDLYVGGAFTKVNGTNRAGVVALPKATGTGAGTFIADLQDVNSYDPAVQVHDIFVHAGYVYLCGDWWITEDQGQLYDPGKTALKDQQYNSGKFHKSGASVHVPVPDGALPTRPWGPRTDGAIQACDIDPQSNLLYLGGHFDLTNSRHIGKLAAADLTTGALLESWDTDSSRIRGLDAVEVDPGKSVAVAGTFNKTGGVEQSSFAAFAVGQPGGPSGGTTFPTQTEPVGGDVPALTKKGGGSPSMRGGCATPAANPCDTSTGNKYENFTDLVVPGRGVPLAFTRSYNSSPGPNDAPADGPLGYGWSFNYNMSLTIATGLSPVTVNEENGAAVTFTLVDGAYTAPPRVMATLVRNADNTWTFTRANREIHLFNSSGRLTALKDLNGYTTSLSYSAGQLTTVTDPAGRTLTFGWTGGRITSVTDTATPPRSVTFSYSSAGDLTDVIDVGGGHWTFTYDANHRMKTKRTPKYFGDTTTTPTPEVTNTYDAQGRVATQRDPLGGTHTFDYTSIANATKVTDPKGNVRVDTFDYGLLVSRTLGYGTPGAATWQYRYDPATLARTAILDPNGDVTTMVYDSAGNLLASADALGRATWSTYNALNQPLTVTDAAGVTTSFTYDAAGNVLTASTPLEGSNPPVSASTTSTYGDPARPGDVTKTTDPDGKEWLKTWDTHGNLATETDPLGNTTRYCYDPVGRRTKVISPKGTAAGVTCATANPTFTTIIEPNAFGAPLVVTDPLGHQTVTTYDANGNRTTTTDANGHTTTWVYDPANQLIEEIRPGDGGGGGGGIEVGLSTSDANAAPASTLVLTTPSGVAANDVMIAAVAVRGVPTVTAPTGWTLIRSDSNGSSMKLLSYQRVATGSEPANYTWSFSSSRAAAGTITAYSGVDTTNPVDGHNGLAELDDITSIVAPSVTTTGTDERIIGLFAIMKDTTITEPSGMTERGEATSAAGTEPPVTIASADTTQTTAGATGDKTATAPIADRNTGQLIALRPATSSGGGGGTGAATTRRYDYHPDGSLWHYYDGADEATTYGYDPLGRQTTVTDPLNRTTTYGYDLAGRLVRKQDHGGNCAATPKTACTTMTYDDGGQLTGINYSDPATPDVTNITYDHLGRRTAMTDGTGTSTWNWDSLGRLTSSADGAGKTVGYGYDRRGNVTSIAYPGTTGTVLRTFDDAGRLWKVKDWLEHETVFNYDPNGFLTSQVNPNGTTATNTPDAAGQLIGISHAPTASPSTPFASFSYGRDNVDQVKSVASTGVPTDNHTYEYTPMNQLRTDNGGTYAYDNADNLAGFASGANLAHDAANQLSSLTNTAGTTTFGYDTRGNRTTVTPPGGSASTLTYDQANRLTGHNTANAAYRYNGDGVRMSRTVGGLTTGFTWDVAQGLPLLLVDGTTNYVYGPGGLPLEQISSAGQVTYYHQDQLGSTRALTSSSGTVVATYTYDPYGNLAGSTGTATNPFRFAGEYTDAETGLVYLRARYYDPGTGQFLSVDPQVDLTREPYGYVGGNPLNRIDPTGENWVSDRLSDAGGAIVDGAKAAGGFVAEHRHTAIDVAIGIGGASVAAGCGLTVVCGVAVVGVAAVGAGVHIGSDAFIDDDNQVSVLNAVTRSVGSTAAGAACGWTFLQGCGPATLGRTSSTARAELPFLTRIVTRTSVAVGSGRLAAGAYWGLTSFGKSALNYATSATSC